MHGHTKVLPKSWLAFDLNVLRRFKFASITIPLSLGRGIVPAKFVPIAGQVISSALTYTSLKYVCEQHIRQCIDVSRQLMLPAPAGVPPQGVPPRGTNDRNPPAGRRQRAPQSSRCARC